MKKVYITTSIPYVNATPHIGYALEAVQADVLSRYYRLLSYDTRYQIGTDENAIKNAETAEKLGISTKELVDKNSQAFYNLKTVLNLSFDYFIRTTSENHIKGSQKFWDLCSKDIYKKKYSGLYCVGCEAFYKEGELENNICPAHNKKLEIVTEENYFFALSKYQNKLKEIITKNQFEIFPAYRKQEILNFIDKGLEDFSISRPKERAKNWGISVPGDDSQKIYVWFDALLNYITGLDFADNGELYKKYWLDNDNKLLVIGKDIIKFHAIYWPAMLLSAGIPMHNKIFVHGFINVNGQKMSKSLGNVINPADIVAKYGTDAVRYYLLREIPSFADGDYSDSRMREIYNSELANEIGNLVSRITNIAEKDGIENAPPEPQANNEYHKYIENFEFNKAIETIINIVKSLNKDVNDYEPWKKIPDERKEFLIKSLNQIFNIGHLLDPIIPDTAGKIKNAATGKIVKINPLFPRLSH